MAEQSKRKGMKTVSTRLFSTMNMVRKNIQMNGEEIKAQQHHFSLANNLLTSVILRMR
jgi:hypothetical protein